MCRDSDCDFICDIAEGIETLRDSDGDGMPDYLDRDSDGDGVRDRDEAGDEDRLTPAADRDGNGVPDYLDPAYPLHFQPPPSGAPDGDSGHGGDTAGMQAEPPPDAGMSLPNPPEPRDPDDEPAKPTHPAYQNTTQSALCRSDEELQSQCSDGELGILECDGLDNDCDGRVDNDVLCPCSRGAARSCFDGPAGRRSVGACHSGIQRCVGDEFSHWGPCEDSVGPSIERCDGVDNDCDGCSDELEACTPSLSCPTEVADAQPFVPYVLDAGQFYAGPDAISYHFSIRGSPCDRLWHVIDSAADAVSGKQSFVVRAESATRTEVVFALSGSYVVELVVVTPTGELHCSFVVHVRGPGLRVELCWDKTGPDAQRGGDAVDLDLHLAKAGTTQTFETPSDCYWQTCRGESSPWGYANTSQLSSCTGPSAQNYATYSALGFCPNPRLDADNRLDARSRGVYIAENINMDVLTPGDRFRIAVMYKANVLSDVQQPDAGTASIDTRAFVNVYCEGALLGSFGGDPEQALDPDAIHLAAPGMLWRVADVAVSKAGCAISPLRDPAALEPERYWISSHDVSYGKL